MTYNPRIQNIDSTVTVSGNLKFANPATTISASNLSVLYVTSSNTISASNTIINGLSYNVFKNFRTLVTNTDKDLSVDKNMSVVVANTTNDNIVIYLPSISESVGNNYTIKKNDNSSNLVFIYGKEKELNIESSNYFYQKRLSGSLANNASDQFGYSVALNSAGDIALVGVPNDETGSNGTPDKMGVVYIFKNINNNWFEEKFLTGSFATGSNDQFGYSVALNSSGDVALIGAPNDETGSNGTPDKMGIAYIFRSSSTGWVQERFLTGSLAIATNDQFGYSVALNSSGNIALIGTPFDETGSAGDPASMGLTYIFRSSSTGWAQERFLTGSLATGSNDRFGISVALNSPGDIALIGAPADETGSAGDPDAMGVAYIFRSASSGWIQEKFLTGSFATGSSDQFGYSVALNSSGDVALIGAPADETGSAGDPDAMGVAYIFRSSSAGWVQERFLTGSLAKQVGDRFGWSVALNSVGDVALIGTRYDGFNNDNGFRYIFRSASSGWYEHSIIQNPYIYNGYRSSNAAGVLNSSGNIILFNSSLEQGVIPDLNNVVQTSTGYCYIYKLSSLQPIDDNLYYVLNSTDSVTLSTDGTGSWRII